MPAMVGETWTDERLDDLSKRMDESENGHLIAALIGLLAAHYLG